jgi:hypothetical protein
MTCPLCERRKARRDCPALGRSICSVCCGTKRLVEIACPDSCVHLTAARANPAAVVRKQYEADLDVLLPTVQALTERQHQLFFLFQSVITRHQLTGLRGSPTRMSRMPRPQSRRPWKRRPGA